MKLVLDILTYVICGVRVLGILAGCVVFVVEAGRMKREDEAKAGGKA